MTIDIIGNGRIGQAIFLLLKQLKFPAEIFFNRNEEALVSADLYIGTLAGGIGAESLKYAIQNKVNLIDLADIENTVYLEHEQQIIAAGITVIPAAGFCPGLVDFILGHEFSKGKKFDKIEIKAGSLSDSVNYFPFLWCFEDMILEFLNDSEQLIEGDKKTFPAFAGYEVNEFDGIQYESYLGQSGFEYITDNTNIDMGSFIYRNLRPIGFKTFFQYMDNYGFFSPSNFMRTKEIVESKIKDNLSCAVINIEIGKIKKEWKISCLSKADEALNSMQKITALFSIAILQLLATKPLEKGIVTCHSLGQDEDVFKEIILFMRSNGVQIGVG